MGKLEGCGMTRKSIFSLMALGASLSILFSVSQLPDEEAIIKSINSVMMLIGAAFALVAHWLLGDAE